MFWLQYISTLEIKPETAWPFIAVLVFIFLDWVTGLSTALVSGTFKSSKMRKGIGNKLGEIFAMVLIYVLSFFLPLLGIMNGNSINVLPLILASYIVIMEVGSMVENITKLSPKTGRKLKEMMDDIEGGIDE